MKLDNRFFIEIFRNIKSPILAFSCCKSKAEKAILNHFAFHIEKNFKENEIDNLFTWIEYAYSHFLTYNNDPFKYIRADLAIVDKNDSDDCHAVFEAKLNYTFDCFTSEFTKMKEAICNDLSRLEKIALNKKHERVRKFFLQFLVHYHADSVHDYIFVYGAGHNNAVKKCNSHLLVIEKAENKTFNYIKNEVGKKFTINSYGLERITLGSYKGNKVILSVILVELENSIAYK